MFPFLIYALLLIYRMSMLETVLKLLVSLAQAAKGWASAPRAHSAASRTASCSRRPLRTLPFHGAPTYLRLNSSQQGRKRAQNWHETPRSHQKTAKKQRKNSKIRAASAPKRGSRAPKAPRPAPCGPTAGRHGTPPGRPPSPDSLLFPFILIIFQMYVLYLSISYKEHIYTQLLLYYYLY